MHLKIALSAVIMISLTACATAQTNASAGIPTVGSVPTVAPAPAVTVTPAENAVVVKESSTSSITLTPTQVVTVSLNDYRFVFTPTLVTAGVVTFVVQNDSMSIIHEFFLVKTDLAVDKLPMASDGASIDEDSGLFTKLGSVEDVDPGKGGEMTVKLEPGRYVYFCNKPAHYKLGMAGEITVAP